MGIREYRPTSAGRRVSSVSDFAEISDRKRPPLKSLLTPKKKKSGRNFQGVITSRHRGGGHKRMYRQIDFKRDHDGVPARVASIEYDPNRSARIALLIYRDGLKAYILAPHNLQVDQVVMSGPDVECRLGNALPLSKIQAGLSVHNIEMQPGGGGQMCRTAGTSAILSAKGDNWAQLTLPSGESRRVHANCRATVGVLGNPDHMNVRIGKAGRNRWKGWRPYVRGVAMNPVAHPMGGGEGKTSGGRHPCSPTGKLAKGGKTRKRRKPSSRQILQRRKSRRYG